MKMLAHTLLSLLLVSSTYAGPLSRSEIAKPSADSAKYRLPSNVKPIKYDLRLAPNIDAKTFKGSVDIEIEILEETDSIKLHEKDLTIKQDDVKVFEKDGNEIQVISANDVDPTDDYEFFLITLKTKLLKGKIYLIKFVNFEGTLNEERRGFYIARYTENGVPKEFATTQFEPTSARRAFPCFDEPALKANFKIRLVRPNAKYNSVSNMPLVTASTPGALEDEFEETPKMSTYLLAFIVSEMSLSETVDRHRVLARKSAIADKQHTYALITGDAELKAIEKFVNVPYSLLKMDQAGIPDSYFSAGAMENWGLVTYKEAYLLYSKEKTTSNNHQFIATIIAHEFGHQWFGNLITPTWWKYIWLNEGFATYFEYRAAAAAEPSWRMMDQFVVKNTQFVFGADGLEGTRPMNQDAGKPTEISALFDRVAYEKSGSVIRMMEAFLTTDVFQKGLNFYLTEKTGDKAVATPSDLYRNFQKAVDQNKNFNLPNGLSVEKIMQTWDSQKGYPVVTVTRDYTIERVDKVHLTQKRFIINNISTENDPWIIPLSFAKENDPRFEVTTADEWLTEPKLNVTIEGLDKENWLIVNKQETGYYRVNYDNINWNLLIFALQSAPNPIDILNRAQLIDDSFNLARSARLGYNIPLELSLYLKNETDYMPFYSFFTAASFVNKMVSSTIVHPKFQEYILNILDGVYDHLGFEEGKDDEHLDKLNRINVLNWLCNMGHSECRTSSLAKVKAWKKDEEEEKEDVSSITLNLQATIFCGAMRQANADEWQFLFSKYEKEVMDGSDNDLRVRLFSSLGCSENIEILNSFLDEVLEVPSKIKSGDDVFASVYNAGPVGLKVAFDYVSTNFINLHNKLGNNLKNVLSGIGSKFTTKEQLTQLNELSTQHPAQADLFNTATANAEENIKWNDKHLVEITNWFIKDDCCGTISQACYSSFLIAISYFMTKLFN